MYRMFVSVTVFLGLLMLSGGVTSAALPFERHGTINHINAHEGVIVINDVTYIVLNTTRVYIFAGKAKRTQRTVQRRGARTSIWQRFPPASGHAHWLSRRRRRPRTQGTHCRGLDSAARHHPQITRMRRSICAQDTVSKQEDHRRMNSVTHTPRQPCRALLASLLLLVATVLGFTRVYAAEPQTMHYKNGDLYVGETLNGERHGQGTYTFHDGKKYVGAWQHDKRHGQGTLTFPNGDVYAGEFADGTFHGQGTYTFQDGSKYAGAWENDKRHGQGTLTFPNGGVYTGAWQQR